MTIRTGSLWGNCAHRNIGEIILGDAGVTSCTNLSNRCKLGLANQWAGIYTPPTELELIRFRPFPFWDLVWHLRIQVNSSDLAAYITVFDPSRGNHRCFIPFLVCALVYPSIASKLVNLATLSPWYDSIRTDTCSTFPRKPLLS